MENLKTIEESLIQTIKKSELKEISVDFSEIALDAFLDEGVLKDIPIINSIIGIGKVSNRISETLLLKKIVHFLHEIGPVDLKKRGEMVNKIDSNPKFKLKIGQKLIYILEKSEDHISAQYIGQLFSSFLKEDLNYEEFLRGSRIIQNLITEDLEYFLKEDISEFEGENAMSPDGPMDYIDPLINVGICSLTTSEVTVEDQWDHKASDKYVVAGGQLEVYVTNIGLKLKNTLNLI